MKQGGYTLLEAIVAIGIFAIVSLMAVGATITMLGAYNKTQTTQVIVDSLNFSIEAMTRDVRFGKSYSCGNCNGGDDITVDFVGPDDVVQTIMYELDNGRLYRQIDSDPRVAITPSLVEITTFDVYVTGQGNTDGAHPKATFVIEGVFNVGQAQTDFSLQTSVSQREAEDRS